MNAVDIEEEVAHVERATAEHKRRKKAQKDTMRSTIAAKKKMKKGALLLEESKQVNRLCGRRKSNQLGERKRQRTVAIEIVCPTIWITWISLLSDLPQVDDVLHRATKEGC